jgi:competence protein ComEC
MRQRVAEHSSAGGSPAEATASAGRLLAMQLLLERERWPLWLPVGFGAGVGFYFALASEPPIWLGTAGVAFALLLAVAGRLRSGPMFAALALAAVFGGFAAAQLRTQQVAAPILQEELRAVDVIGRVVEVEPRERGDRILLAHPEIEGLPPSHTPARVRTTVAAGAPGIVPGDRVRLLAVLQPPPEPAAPGAFDFARRAFFQRLGGVGFALGRVERLSRPPAGMWTRWREWWAGLRRGIAARVRDGLPVESGAVAAALMTGERGAIPEGTREDMRQSGLAHLLAISGLHLGLVAGIVFFVVRAVLALIPTIALRWPIKKWAAAVAIVAAASYMLLVGATVPTQRAFAMTGLVLLAVALDRRAFTMRLVAWAAMAVLLFSPEALLGASFQMSFAAVTALVAAYETLRSRAGILARAGQGGMLSRALLYIGGVALTSLVAMLATAPFAAFHFNRVALFGLIANIVAVPLTAFWIMPWALAAFMMIPFGLEAVALTPLGWGLDALLMIAGSVSAWPGAAVGVSSVPVWALGLVAIGGLWLCLWSRRWRLLGLVPVACGAAALAFVRPPDVLVSGDGRLMAVRGADGTMWLSSERRERFTADVWRRRAGTEESRAFDAAGPADAIACDSLGCIFRRYGNTVALVEDGRALPEDCRAATILISTDPVDRHDCPGPIVVIDRFDIWRDGAHALWLSRGPPGTLSVRDHRGSRPWVRRRQRDQ